MQNRSRVFVFMLSLMVLSSCGKEDTDPTIPKAIAVTGDCTQVTETTATVFGWCNQKEQEGLSAVYGIEYSDTDLTTAAVSVKAVRKDSDNMFSCKLTGLSNDTKYYYRTYVLFNAVRSYGEVKSFTTKNFSATVTTYSATDVEYYSATLNGKIELTSIDVLPKTACFYYSATETTVEGLIRSGTKVTVLSGISENGTFYANVSGMTSSTKYNYIAVCTVKNQDFHGAVTSFTTSEIKASITAESSNVSYHTATISGVLTVTSNGSFYKAATLYYSSTASTLEALKSSGTKKTLSLNQDGTYSENLSSLILNTKYYYVVVGQVDNVKFASSVNYLTTMTRTPPAGAVELGLSVLWATCNIGTSCPEGYGTYFAWGDVIGQTWSGSSWSGGGFSTDPSYELDKNGNLKPEYDAAHVNLGGNWRMPTSAECQELIDNCTSTWTSNYEGTGVAGQILTSKKEGYTDKSIFLPATGSGCDSKLDSAGSTGNFYSSSCIFGSTYAIPYYMAFNSIGVWVTASGGGCYGRTIRPVTE